MMPRDLAAIDAEIADLRRQHSAAVAAVRVWNGRNTAQHRAARARLDAVERKLIGRYTERALMVLDGEAVTA